MSRANLTLFKEKYSVSDYFVSVVESLFNKLVEFEYIPNSKVQYFIDKLMDNIDQIRFGNNIYDYKSGYYDANKKELYIKDEKNIPAVYLRLLYALTTTETDPNVFTIGYSTTKLRKDSYKLSYTNFGINRAIIANLVYKLCNLIPSNLQLTPIQKTHSHDFLGFKIEAANELYCLEGKLLSETCYVLDLDPELLYLGLFSKNTTKYLDNIFAKKNFINKDKFLKLFDKISKKYNTYNKLAFLSNKLNNNYIEYKKNILKSDIENILKEQEIIEANINSVILSLNKSDVTDELESAPGLSETLETLETDLIQLLIKFQDILSENIIQGNSSLPYIKYVSKLKCFNDILIVPNKKVQKTIQDTILYKLMPKTEVTGINLIQKIKYAIIEHIISDSDFANISNTFSFYNVTCLEDSNAGTALILLNANRRFARVVEVSGLNQTFKKSSNFKLDYIPLDNLKHLMNITASNTSINNIEALYTALRNNFEELNNISLDCIFTFEYNNNKYLVCYTNTKPYVISYVYSSRGYGFNMLNLSEQYKVFGKTTQQSNSIIKSNLPILKK